MFEEKDIERHSKWTWWMILLVILAIIIFVFSFYAPKILVEPSNSSATDFSQTGQIGDTIGGIMNPFVAIVGVILTFLAFWIQFQANRLQYKQNFNNREYDIQKKKEEKDKYLKDHLRLIRFDLHEIIRDVKFNLPLLKDFYEIEYSKPVQTNILKRTAQSSSIKKILDMNRLAVFNAFQQFIPQNPADTFGKYQNSLEYLSSMFENFYSVVDSHVAKKFTEMNSIISKLDLVLNLASGIISKKDIDPISPEVLDLLNKLIKEYYLIINEALDENGNVKEQTNFLKLSQTALKNFLEKSLFLKKNDLAKYDFRLEEIEVLISQTRKQIFKVKQDGLKVAGEVKQQYEVFKIGILNEEDESPNQESILRTLESIESTIEQVLNSD